MDSHGYDGPTETEVMSWNEHNDHADGAGAEGDVETGEFGPYDLVEDGPAPAEVDFFSVITAVTAWLDASNEDSPHEDSMRVLKLVEEAGEAASAYIGMTGQNPRKGVTHTRADLLAELIDVAITALCAVQHFTKDETETRAAVAVKLDRLLSRVGLSAAAPQSARYLIAATEADGRSIGEISQSLGGVEWTAVYSEADLIYRLSQAGPNTVIHVRPWSE
jgi:NTP pyrophosphatase (non-canonical NTP hydrolase)